MENKIETTIMENQMEKEMENEMETAIMENQMENNMEIEIETTIMENQTEKKMENEMETTIMENQMDKSDGGQEVLSGFGGCKDSNSHILAQCTWLPAQVVSTGLRWMEFKLMVHWHGLLRVKPLSVGPTMLTS